MSTQYLPYRVSTTALRNALMYGAKENGIDISKYIKSILEERMESLGYLNIVKNREALRMAQDIVSVWSKECCVGNPSVMTETSALYANWKNWCKHKDIGCGSIKAFSQRLGLLGWKRGLEGSNRRSVFYGVSIVH